MAVEIKQVLEREFDVNLTAQDLRNLTFGRLQELTDSFKKGDKASSNKGESMADVQRNMLLRSIGHEQSADKIILPLNETDAMKNAEAIALWIPGIEGVISPALYSFFKNIEIPTFALQLHAHCKIESFQTLITLISKVRKIQIFGEKMPLHINFKSSIFYLGCAESVQWQEEVLFTRSLIRWNGRN